MEILVETFEIEDVCSAGGKPELNEKEVKKYKKLISNLHLEGQKSITSSGNEEKRGDIIPFQLLDDGTKAQWQAICPHVSDVTRYAGSLIPLRVLEVLALCEKRGYFKAVQVWSATADLCDPLLIGHVKDSYLGGPLYLLARWGAELFPFDELFERAKEALTETWKAECAALIAECKQLLDGGMTSLVLKKLKMGTAQTPW